MAKRSADHVKSSSWYIDSGASRHFNYRRDWFTDYQTYLDSFFFMWRGRVHRCRQRQHSDSVFWEESHFLRCVLCSRDGTKSTLSQLLQHFPQLDVTFSSCKCTIIDRETQSIVAVGLEDHGRFKLIDSDDSRDLAMAARQSSVNTLWQQQYGQLNVHYLSHLAWEELVLGLPKIQTQQLGVCDAC